MHTAPTYYLIAVGISAAIVALFIEIMLTSIKAQRRASRLDAELRRVREELHRATGLVQVPISTPMPPRWTPTQIIKFISVTTTLVGAMAALPPVYGKFQTRALPDHQQEFNQAVNLVRHPPSDWVLTTTPLSIDGKGRPEEMPIDHKNYSGDCSAKKLTIAYEGWSPGVLHCGQGSVSIRLSGDSILLFVPAN